MAVEHDLRLQSKDRVDGLDPVEGPARLGSSDSVDIGKRHGLRYADAGIVVAYKGNLVSGDPDGKVVGGFTGRAE